MILLKNSDLWSTGFLKVDLVVMPYLFIHKKYYTEARRSRSLSMVDEKKF